MYVLDQTLPEQMDAFQQGEKYPAQLSSPRHPKSNLTHQQHLPIIQEKGGKQESRRAASNAGDSAIMCCLQSKQATSM